MDVQTRPLKLWERVYWRLFVVMGGVGFAYETWVLGNRGIWIAGLEKKVEQVGGNGVSGLYGGNQVFGSQRLLTDEEVEGGGWAEVQR